MSATSYIHESYEHPLVIDDSEDPLMDFWPGSISLDDRAWNHLRPALVLDRAYQTQSQDWPLKAYDPAAHGFVEPPQGRYHSNTAMNPLGYTHRQGYYPYRYLSPVSGISQSSIGSGSPTYAMSPELATAALPASILHTPVYYSSPSSYMEDNTFPMHVPAPVMLNGGYRPTMPASNAFHMNAFLHKPEVHEESMLGGSEFLVSRTPYPEEVDLSLENDLEQDDDQTDHVTDSGVGLSTSNSHVEDDAAADTDMEDAEATNEDVDNDSSYDPGRGLTSPASRAPSHRPTRTKPIRGHARGPSVTSPDARVHKNVRSPTKRKTTVKNKNKSKINHTFYSSNRTSTPAVTVTTTTIPRSSATTTNSVPTNSVPTKTRQPFPCPFHHFGCAATFPSKNEWKRHALSQHLRLGYYRCDLGACNISHPSNITATRGFNDFNRKDLFTQHCRRMHKPAEWGRREYGDVGPRERGRYDEGMEGVRDRCWVQRREAPGRVGCGFCGEVFCEELDGGKGAGRDVWEVRMEHVARHFEREGQDKGEEGLDEGLLDWCVENEVVVKGLDGDWWLSELVGMEGEAKGLMGLGGVWNREETGVRRKRKAIKTSAGVKSESEGRRRSGRFDGIKRKSYASFEGDDDEEEEEEEGSAGGQHDSDEEEEVVVVEKKVSRQAADDDNDECGSGSDSDTDTDAPGEAE